MTKEDCERIAAIFKVVREKAVFKDMAFSDVTNLFRGFEHLLTRMEEATKPMEVVEEKDKSEVIDNGKRSKASSSGQGKGRSKSGKVQRVPNK